MVRGYRSPPCNGGSSTIIAPQAHRGSNSSNEHRESEPGNRRRPNVWRTVGPRNPQRQLLQELHVLRQLNQQLHKRIQYLERARPVSNIPNSAVQSGGSGATTRTPNGSQRSNSVRGSGQGSTQSLNSSRRRNQEPHAQFANTLPPVSQQRSPILPQAVTVSRPPVDTAQQTVATRTMSFPVANSSIATLRGVPGVSKSIPHGIMPSRTVAVHPYAGAIQEASRLKGTPQEDDKPIFSSPSTSSWPIDIGVGATRLISEKITEVPTKPRYTGTTSEIPSIKDVVWHYMPKVKERSLPADEYLLCYLLNKFAFVERSANTMRRMWESLDRVMRDLDTRGHSLREIYLLKHQAVRAAMVPPLEDLVTRKVLQGVDSIKKHSKFTTEGDLGSTFEISTGLFSNLLQSSKKLAANK
uniref:Uncharacterized protein n=1 Tax=Flen tombus-like virus TaxID=2665437 RepID=A0A5Q0V0P6_9TOMB|nr:hypothetical protein [Flen tombus-like virus]